MFTNNGILPISVPGSLLRYRSYLLGPKTMDTSLHIEKIGS